MKNKIGDEIRRMRKKCGITQVELADKANIAVNSLRRYEANERNPKTETLICIADALKISRNELLRSAGIQSFFGEIEKTTYEKIIDFLSLLTSDEHEKLYRILGILFYERTEEFKLAKENENEYEEWKKLDKEGQEKFIDALIKRNEQMNNI